MKKVYILGQTEGLSDATIAINHMRAEVALRSYFKADEIVNPLKTKLIWNIQWKWLIRLVNMYHMLNCEHVYVLNGCCDNISISKSIIRARYFNCIIIFESYLNILFDYGVAKSTALKALCNDDKKEIDDLMDNVAKSKLSYYQSSTIPLPRDMRNRPVIKIIDDIEKDITAITSDPFSMLGKAMNQVQSTNRTDIIQGREEVASCPTKTTLLNRAGFDGMKSKQLTNDIAFEMITLDEPDRVKILEATLQLVQSVKAMDEVKRHHIRVFGCEFKIEPYAIVNSLSIGRDRTKKVL